MYNPETGGEDMLHYKVKIIEKLNRDFKKTKMLSLSLPLLALRSENLSTIGPWKLHNYSGQQLLSTSCARLGCESINSEYSSTFARLNWVSRSYTLTGAISAHAKRKTSKLEEVKESLSIDEDLLPVLNQISNEAVKAMVMPKEKEVNELKEKVCYLERSLVQEGKTDAARFMLIIGGMLDHTVPAEKDELNHVYKAAFIKIWNIVEDSGWPLKFENEETLQEMVDDDLIPPVVQSPY